MKSVSNVFPPLRRMRRRLNKFFVRYGGPTILKTLMLKWVSSLQKIRSTEKQNLRKFIDRYGSLVISDQLLTNILVRLKTE